MVKKLWFTLPTDKLYIYIYIITREASCREYLLAFSCKRRHFCPSCQMAVSWKAAIFKWHRGLQQRKGVKALREEKVYQRNDERILGDEDFVGRVLASAEEDMERRYALRARGFDLDSVAARVSEVLQIKTEDIWAKGKYQRIVAARSVLCYWAVRELGIPMSNLSIKLGISIPSINISVRREQRIAEENEFTLLAS